MYIYIDKEIHISFHIKWPRLVMVLSIYWLVIISRFVGMPIMYVKKKWAGAERAKARERYREKEKKKEIHNSHFSQDSPTGASNRFLMDAPVDEDVADFLDLFEQLPSADVVFPTDAEITMLAPWCLSNGDEEVDFSDFFEPVGDVPHSYPSTRRIRTNKSC